jgi:hypothetical protein
MLRFIRSVAIILATIVLATLATNAFDMRDSLRSSLVGTALAPLVPESTICPQGMTHIASAGGGFCIDTFEAAPGDGCPYQNPSRPSETQANMAAKGCMADSEKGAKAWTFVSQTDAQLACAAAGKRLAKADEWYRAALGTPDASDKQDCNVSTSSLAPSGSLPSCASFAGAYDMVGNAWEWVEEQVVNGNWSGRLLPPNGYVQEADLSGIAISTNPQERNESFGYARFWSDEALVTGMMRGGYYNSGEDAGLFAVHAASPPSFKGNAVGFRCVSNIMQ